MSSYRLRRLLGAVIGGPFACVWGLSSLGCTSSEDVGSSFQEVTSGGEGGHGGSSDPGPVGPGPASSGPSSTSSSGHGGAGASTSSSSGAGGDACADTDEAEPNESESAAFDLGALGDCDDEGGEHQGTLADGDIDWFKYKGDDGIGCVVNPWRDVTSMGAFRFCKYAQCDSGNPGFSCPTGTTAETSPDGRSGCCGADGFELDLDCSGVDDNAWIYMRLDQPDPACSTYTLAWHY